jgi:phosphoribosyl 1,2-cyclic phosphodiesterase
MADTDPTQPAAVRVTFAGCGDAFGSGARFQACIHLERGSLDAPVLLDCGATSRRTRPLVVAGPAGTSRRLTEAMECMFPGSSQVRRRFEVEVVELRPGYPAAVAGVRADVLEASHPSGGPALILRLTLGAKVIAYTGDTAWTPAIGEAARDADLLIAEAYQWDKAVPHHLRHADLAEHEHDLAAGRTILTHMSTDMLGRLDQARYETAHDGLVLLV